MAILTASVANFSLTSSFTVSYDSYGEMSVSTPSTAKTSRIFNLGAIPAGATINSAKLSCSVGGSLYGGTHTQDGSTTLLNLPVTVVAGSNKTVEYTYKSGNNVSYGTAAGQKISTTTFSNVKLVVDYVAYAPCSPPTAIALAVGLAAAGALVRLSWYGAAAGTNNPIAGYEVYRAASAAGSYSKIGATTSTYLNVAAPATAGATYFFKVIAKGTAAGYDSALSSVYAALKANTPPAKPVVDAPDAGRTTYNLRPRILVTIGADADGHTQLISAPGYTASRASYLAAGQKILLHRSANDTVGAKTVLVIATDQLSEDSPAASVGFTLGALDLTDPSLTAGTTSVKAVHMTELRTAINLVRAYYGLGEYAWASSIISGSTSLAGWKAHILEMRAAIDDVVSKVNSWDPASTAGNIALPAWTALSDNNPSAAIVQQIRNAIPLL